MMKVTLPDPDDGEVARSSWKSLNIEAENASTDRIQDPIGNHSTER